jgi:hypothetical protein
MIEKAELKVKLVKFRRHTQLRVRRLSEILSAPYVDDSRRRGLTYRAVELDNSYATKARLELNAPLECNGRWFIGRNGKALAGHTVRDRVAKMMRFGFPKQLWNSLDVFATTV